jgi:Holliday junction DNA helicase RuvB
MPFPFPDTHATDVQGATDVIDAPATATLDEWARATKKSSPRPTTWDSIIGNDRAKTQIREAIAAAKKDGRPLPHILIYAAAGSGKTTFSKIIAQDMGGGFVESTASTLEVPADVIRIIWKLNALRATASTNAASTLFLDEVHTLGVSRGRMAIDQESMFTLLEDFQFFHNLINKTVQDDAGCAWRLTDTVVRAWPFTVIGATTEPGALSPPLLRRFLLQIQLDPYTEDEIARILIGAGQRLGLTITEDSAATLSKYSRRNPGTGNSLIEYARARASAADRTIIDKDTAMEVVERLNLYPLGLNAVDIRVLKGLYDRGPRGMGQSEIARSIGVSLSQFIGVIEPYLTLLSFIEVQSRRVIRPEGIRYLASIGRVDTTRPDVRAALA